MQLNWQMKIKFRKKQGATLLTDPAEIRQKTGEETQGTTARRL